MDDTTPKRSVVRATRVTKPIFNSDVRNYMSGMAKVRVAKFCRQVEYIKCKPWGDKLPTNGRGHGHVTRFLILTP